MLASTSCDEVILPFFFLQVFNGVRQQPINRSISITIPRSSGRKRSNKTSKSGVSHTSRGIYLYPLLPLNFIVVGGAGIAID